MSATSNFLAVDLGASNGRVFVGCWDGTRFELRELHRFANGAVNILGNLHWGRINDRYKKFVTK